MADLGLFITVARLAGLWVTFTTNSPLFVILFFLFNGLPNWGILLSPIAVTLIAFIAISSGYLAEIQRGCIQSVRQAELEATKTLGMSRRQTVRHVIAPHVIKTVYPALSNFFILTMLGTSMAALVSQAGVFELMFAGKALANRGIDPFVFFSGVLLAYFAISWPPALFGRYLEARLPRPVTGGK